MCMALEAVHGCGMVNVVHMCRIARMPHSPKSNDLNVVFFMHSSCPQCLHHFVTFRTCMYNQVHGAITSLSIRCLDSTGSSPKFVLCDLALVDHQLSSNGDVDISALADVMCEASCGETVPRSQNVLNLPALQANVRKFVGLNCGLL